MSLERRHRAAVARRDHSHASDYRMKKNCLELQVRSFSRGSSKSRPNGGGLCWAQFRMLNLGCAKVRYLAGSLALRNQLRRGAMQSSKGRMIKPPKPGIACMQTPAYKQINGPRLRKNYFLLVAVRHFPVDSDKVKLKDLSWLSRWGRTPNWSDFQLVVRGGRLPFARWGFGASSRTRRY